MKKIFLKVFVGLLFAINAVSSIASPAKLIEVTGELIFHCATGGTFEDECEDMDYGETGTFKLVYDPSTRDSDEKYEDYSFFKNSIRSFTLNMNQLNRENLVFSLVGRGDMSVGRPGYWETGIGWALTLREKNNRAPISKFEFGLIKIMETEPVIDRLPSADFWTGVYGYEAGGGGAYETDWLIRGSVSAREIPRPVPAPSPAWLLLIGVVAATISKRFSKSI